MATNGTTPISVESTESNVPPAVRSGALAMLPLLASYVALSSSARPTPTAAQIWPDGRGVF